MSCDPVELTRFVLVGSQLRIDPTGHAHGRGAWLHADADCVAEARRRGSFARSFGRKVNDSVLDGWPQSEVTSAPTDATIKHRRSAPA